jgi:periplasmic divalent cation tolerance protein
MRMYAIIYITTSGFDESKKIAKILVDEKLVACTNIIPSIESIYLWKGETETDSESIIIAKTIKNNVNPIMKRVKEIHSYDIPCILIIPIINGSKDYLEWLKSELS